MGRTGVNCSSTVLWHHVAMPDTHPLPLHGAAIDLEIRQDLTDQAGSSNGVQELTLRNAKSDIEMTFEDASDAASGFLTALSQTDDALYRALQKIYEFVKDRESRPEEFEIFKKARGIRRPNNAKSRFQHYVRFFIKANTDRKDIVGRARKYGAALDEAWEQEVGAEGLAEWIKEQGIENICKERRRRNAVRKPRPKPETVIWEPSSASTEIAGSSPRDPMSDSNTRLVLKLNDRAERSRDQKNKRDFLSALTK
jgi:hypothetical protein